MDEQGFIGKDVYIRRLVTAAASQHRASSHAETEKAVLSEKRVEEEEDVYAVG